MYIEKLIAELESGKDIQKIVSDRLVKVINQIRYI